MHAYAADNASSPYDYGEQRVGLTEGMATRREVTEQDLQNMKMDLIHLLTTKRIE